MLFNSYEFIFLFLPVVVIGYFALGRLGGRTPALVWLILASIGFYAWARVDTLAIILPSIVLDYLIGRGLQRVDPSKSKLRATLLGVGIAANTAFLGYFKYRNFFLDTTNLLFGT